MAANQRIKDLLMASQFINFRPLDTAFVYIYILGRQMYFYCLDKLQGYFG